MRNSDEKHLPLTSMRLSSRLLLFILPPIVLVFLGFGRWSFMQQKDILVSAHRTVLTQKLEGFVASEVVRRHRMLENNGLAETPSFVDRFQQEIFAVARQVFSGPGQQIFILGKDDQLLSASSNLADETVDLLDAVRQFLTAGKPVDHFSSHGVTYNYYVRSFRPWGWRLVLVEQTADIDRLVMTARLFVFFACLALVAIVVAVVTLLSRKFVLTPLHHLEKVAEEIGTTRKPVALPVTGCTEIDHLAHSMNQMARAIEEGDLHNEKLQQELAGKDKLATIGRMAATVRHDLKNPLAAINNSAYYLGLALQDPPEKVSHHLHLIESQVEHCSAIISSLLDFSKPITLDKRPHPLAPLVDECLQASVPDAVEVIKNLEHGDDAVVMDRLQISRVLRNLFENAVQAMDHTGTIAVSSRLDQGYIEIAVEDAGPGIAEDALEKIFEPFFTTRQQGTGLGLAGARAIVEAHGGTLTAGAATTLGGARLLVRLPLQPAS